MLLRAHRGWASSPASYNLIRVNRASPQARGLYRWWPHCVPSGRDSDEMFSREIVRGAEEDVLDNTTTNDSGAWTWLPEMRTWYWSTNTWGGVSRGTHSPLFPFPMTITSWMYYPTSDRGILGARENNNNTGNGWAFTWDSAGLADRPRFTIYGRADYFFTGIDLAVRNKWYWYACTIAGFNATATCYVGDLSFSPLLTDSVTIGASVSGTTGYYLNLEGVGSSGSHGEGFDMRIYNRVLSVPEIERIYRNRLDLFAPASVWTPMEHIAPAGGPLSLHVVSLNGISIGGPFFRNPIG